MCWVRFICMIFMYIIIQTNQVFTSKPVSHYSLLCHWLSSMQCCTWHATGQNVLQLGCASVCRIACILCRKNIFVKLAHIGCFSSHNYVKETQHFGNTVSEVSRFSKNDRKVQCVGVCSTTKYL